MKKLIIILFLSISFVGLCQTKPLEKEKRFAIGINYSIDRTFRTLKPDNSSNSAAVKISRDSREVPSINFTSGIGFSYKISKTFSTEIGVIYARNGYQTEENNLTFSNLENLRRGYQDSNDSPVTGNLVYNLDYLNIPLKLRTYILNRKVRFFVEGGLSTNINLKNKIVINMVNADGYKESFTGGDMGGNVSKINMAFILGVGADYTFKENYVIRLVPTYRRSITQVAKWVNKEYLYSYGINLGLHYKF